MNLRSVALEIQSPNYASKAAIAAVAMGMDVYVFVTETRTVNLSEFEQYITEQ